MRISFDPAKAKANLKKHVVSFADTALIFEGFVISRKDDRATYGESGLSALAWDVKPRYWWWRISWNRTISILSRHERLNLMKHGTTGENTPNTEADEFDIPSLSAAQLNTLRPLNELRPEVQAALSKGKTRITIMLDNDILAVFRDRAEKQGCGYQTLINEALRAYLGDNHAPLTVDMLRRILQEAR